METREEKLATWLDHTNSQSQGLTVLKGSFSLSTDSDKSLHLSEETIKCDQVETHLLNTSHDDMYDDRTRWHFKAVSFPRLRAGRLVLSFPKQVFQRIQNTWNLHPRTIEVFLSNNGVFTTFHSASTGQTSYLLKVANSRSTGFDCVSVTCDPVRRTTYVLYHHLEDEKSIFATLLSTPERCIDPYFFISAMYRSHHQHIEVHRVRIDDAVRDIERQTGFGNPGRLMGFGTTRRASLDEYPVLTDPKSTIQQLSFCQTDLAAIGHVARCSLDCGEWIIQAIDESLLAVPPNNEHVDGSRPERLGQNLSLSKDLRAMRLTIRQDIEYIKKRTAMLLSQVQAVRERAQSQTNFMLNIITQSDAEYTAAIAVDGKSDSIAMRTISVLGIVFLPGTFIATLFGMGMFSWGGTNGSEDSSVKISPNMWIYWVITVPLTIITFAVWALWSRRENHKSSKRLMIHRTKGPAHGEKATAIEESFQVTNEKMV